MPMQRRRRGVAGKAVWCNERLWVIINSHWFHLKRWMGDAQQIADVYSQLSRQQAIALLDGFCRVDGSRSRIQYDSGSEPTGQWWCNHSSFPLIDHLQLIGQLAGAAVDLQRISKAGKTTSIDGRTVTLSVDHWALSFTFTKSQRRIPFQTAPLAQPVDVSDDIDGRGYHDYKNDGRVFCITVEDNSNFLTQRLSHKRLRDGSTRVRAHSVLVGNCVAKGTLIALANGTSVPIERVQKGAHVLSYYAALDPEETEGLTVRQVNAVLDQGVKECVELLFSDGRILVCTPDHRIRTANGRWVEAKDLVVGADEVAVGVEYPNATAVAEGDDEKPDVYRSTDEITHSVFRDAQVLPLFRVQLVGRREVGVHHVYDLSVPSPQGDVSRSFVANGVVVHNCHDNDNSDGFMLSCDTCVVEGTVVGVMTGRGVPIEQVVEEGREVMGVVRGGGEGGGGMGRTVVERGAVGKNAKGERKVHRMWLANGHHLDLTDDHRVFIRTADSTSPPLCKPVRELRCAWRHALNGGAGAEGDEVMMGMDCAVDDLRLDTEEEQRWSLPLLGGLAPLSFTTLPLPYGPPLLHRDRALAFARLLGFVVGRGRVRCRRGGVEECEVSVRMTHGLNVEEWQSDVRAVVGGDRPIPRPKWRRSRHHHHTATTGHWCLLLPAALSFALCALPGSSDEQPLSSSFFSPPTFLTSSSSPLPPSAFVREYVAALYGAVGSPLRLLRRSGDNDGVLDRSIRFQLPRSHPFHPSPSSTAFLHHVRRLLSSSTPIPTRLSHKQCRLSSSSSQSSLSASSLVLSDLLSFSHSVSYRYDVLKQLRLSVACAYLRYMSNIHQQRSSPPSPSPLPDTHTAMPLLHASSSSDHPLHLASFTHFLSAVGVPSLFSSLTLPSLSTVPVYYLPLISLTPLPSPARVYDLSMRPPHPPSFSASSVLVHNCEVWQHGDCLSVNERSVPEQYFCEICMPGHPIHVMNESVKKSAINKKMKGKGKGAGAKAAAVLGSPGMEGKKLEAGKKKTVAGAVEKKEVKAGAGKEMGGKEGKTAPVGDAALKRKKVKREEDSSPTFAATPTDRRDARDQPPPKRAKTDERPSSTTTTTATAREAPSPAAASSSTPAADAASAVAVDEEGGVDSREQKKLKRLLEIIKKSEDQSKKAKKKTDGPDGPAEGKDRDDSTHIGVGLVERPPAIDEDAAMDTTSGPSSPNISTARSVRAKLRAEREEQDLPPSTAGGVEAGPSSAPPLPAKSGDAGRKKRKGLMAGVGSDDESSDVVDFAYRRRAWQQNKARHAVLGPFYLGRKEFLLKEWRRVKEREETGWDGGVKQEEVGLVKRVIDNWREEKREKEEAKEGGPAGRHRMRTQTNTAGIPTCTRAEIVGPPPALAPAASTSPPSSADFNGDRKRKREEDADAAAATAASPSRNGSHAAAPSSSPPAGPSRPSIPKVSRSMVNGVASKASAGTARMVSSSSSSSGNNRVGSTTPH